MEMEIIYLVDKYISTFTLTANYLGRNNYMRLIADGCWLIPDSL
jgi:hypothetical protein